MLGIKTLKVSVTCALAPVFFGDSLAVTVEADVPLDIDRVAQRLGGAGWD